MNKKAFYSADGDMLIVPQKGNLFVTTEFGKLVVEPTEILLVPRGLKFSVDVDGYARGYVCECFKGYFKLPELGNKSIGVSCSNI